MMEGCVKAFAFISLRKMEPAVSECRLVVGERVCVCVFVIYSEAGSASSCPSGIPTTLPAADLPRRGAEEERDGGVGGGGLLQIVEKSTSFPICSFY